jgi:hypothetical protein
MCKWLKKCTKWMPDRDISREITGSTYTANVLHHQHELLKNCCIYMHMKQVWFTDSTNTELDARMNFVNWYLHVMHDGEIYPTHSLCLATLGYILEETRTLHSQVLFAQNPVLIHKGPLHDAKFGVWCATRATRIIGRYLSWYYKLTLVRYTIYNHLLITTEPLPSCSYTTRQLLSKQLYSLFIGHI